MVLLLLTNQDYGFCTMYEYNAIDYLHQQGNDQFWVYRLSKPPQHITKPSFAETRGQSSVIHGGLVKSADLQHSSSTGLHHHHHLLPQIRRLPPLLVRKVNAQPACKHACVCMSV